MEVKTRQNNQPRATLQDKRAQGQPEGLQRGGPLCHTQGAAALAASQTLEATMKLDQIRSRLSAHRPLRIPTASVLRQAAVAAVLRPAPSTGSPELLFIRRAAQERDRWSGHMAFPGGRVDPEDAHAEAAAQRETREELGLDLSPWGPPVARLSDVMARARGRVVPMIISPFVYAIEGDPPLLPNPAEVADTVWIPLDFLMTPENRGSFKLRTLGRPLIPMACYDFGPYRVWGLTLAMVDELVKVLRAG